MLDERRRTSSRRWRRFATDERYGDRSCRTTRPIRADAIRTPSTRPSERSTPTARSRSSPTTGWCPTYDADISGSSRSSPDARRGPAHALPEPHCSARHGVGAARRVVVVIMPAPYLVERVRIPGLIGLLAGGCIIGPNVLGIVSADTGIAPRARRGRAAVPDVPRRARARPRRVRPLPQPGDRVHRADVLDPAGARASIGGFIVGYGFAASLLLGSLFASYTLVAYPIVRNMGLASNGGGRHDGRRHRADRHAGARRPGGRRRIDVRRRQRRRAGLADRARPGDPRRRTLRASCRARQVVLPHASGTQRTLRYVFMLAALLSAGVARRGRRHRGDRRRLLRRARAQPAGAERGRVHGAHRVLRLGAADPDVPRVGRHRDRPGGAGRPGDARPRRRLRRRLHRRQVARRRCCASRCSASPRPRSASCSASRWPRRRRRWRRRSSGCRSACSRPPRSTR